MTGLAVLENETMMLPMQELFARMAPDADLMCFGSTPPALAAARSKPVDVAIIDAVLPELSGLDFGEYLKELWPEVNLIYLTADRAVSFDALRQHASGILPKPIVETELRRELEELRFPQTDPGRKRLFAQTFGNFELFVDGEPVEFKYKRTKEIVALLINNKGAQTTNGEIIASLWERNGVAYVRGASCCSHPLRILRAILPIHIGIQSFPRWRRGFFSRLSCRSGSCPAFP